MADGSADGGTGSGTGSGSMGKPRLPKREAAPKPSVRFLYKPSYEFKVPSAPMDLKMIDLDPQLEQYQNYQVTTIDEDFKRPMIADEMFGVYLDFADMDKYRLYGSGEGLKEEDMTLLAEVDGGRRPLEGPSGPLANMSTGSWMRRTIYDEYEVKRRQSSSGLKVSEKVVPREKRKKLAAESFQLAKKRPIHPDARKQSVKPKRILPLLPNFSAWNNLYNLVQFDANPLNSVFRRGEPDPRDLNRAVILARSGDHNEKFVTQYLPQKVIDRLKVGTKKEIQASEETRTSPEGQGMSNSNQGSAAEDASDNGDYSVVRDYNFNVLKGSDDRGVANSLFIVRGEHAPFAAFAPIHSKMTLQQRPIRRNSQGQKVVHRLILERRDARRSDESQWEEGLEKAMGGVSQRNQLREELKAEFRSEMLRATGQDEERKRRHAANERAKREAFAAELEESDEE